MALAGVTCVGEFHYLHHQTGRHAVRRPERDGRGAEAAATEAGIRITLLDTLYLHGGLIDAGYAGAEVAQRRFSDGTVGAWIDAR